MIFKEAGNDHFTRFSTDKMGNKIESTETPSFSKNSKAGGARLYAEMKKWEAEGNVIEPQFTPKELAAKEKKEADQAIESTKSLCIQYLNETEKYVSSDPPYPDDVERHKTDRANWRTILKSGMSDDVSKPYKGPS